MIKKRLVILSDLWGREKSDWLINYTQNLTPKFDIVFYDCCELAEIDKANYTEENLHNQFVTIGIERAAAKLEEIEKKPLHILAFSIGGTIAWKYGLATNNINSLTCFSSTRLRKETKKPKGYIELNFGGNDAFKPSINWLCDMDIKFHLFKDKEHQFYCEPDTAKQISAQIIKLIH